MCLLQQHSGGNRNCRPVSPKGKRLHAPGQARKWPLATARSKPVLHRRQTTLPGKTRSTGQPKLSGRCAPHPYQMRTQGTKCRNSFEMGCALIGVGRSQTGFRLFLARRRTTGQAPLGSIKSLAQHQYARALGIHLRLVCKGCGLTCGRRQAAEKPGRSRCRVFQLLDAPSQKLRRRRHGWSTQGSI